MLGATKIKAVESHDHACSEGTYCIGTNSWRHRYIDAHLNTETSTWTDSIIYSIYLMIYESLHLHLTGNNLIVLRMRTCNFKRLLFVEATNKYDIILRLYCCFPNNFSFCFSRSLSSWPTYFLPAHLLSFENTSPTSGLLSVIHLRLSATAEA